MKRIKLRLRDDQSFMLMLLFCFILSCNLELKYSEGIASGVYRKIFKHSTDENSWETKLKYFLSGAIPCALRGKNNLGCTY